MYKKKTKAALNFIFFSFFQIFGFIAYPFQHPYPVPFCIISKIKLLWKCLLKLTLIVIKYFQYKKTQTTHSHIYKNYIKKIIQDSIIYSRHITKENKKNNNKTGLRKQKGNSIIFNKKKNKNFLRHEFWGILEPSGERHFGFSSEKKTSSIDLEIIEKITLSHYSWIY